MWFHYKCSVILLKARHHPVFVARITRLNVLSGRKSVSRNEIVSLKTRFSAWRRSKLLARSISPRGSPWKDFLSINIELCTMYRLLLVTWSLSKISLQLQLSKKTHALNQTIAQDSYLFVNPVVAFSPILESKATNVWSIKQTDNKFISIKWETQSL